MMREILFRGKRIDSGEWVCGSFCMDALEQFNGLCGVDGFIRLYSKAEGKMQTHEVARETVGQFTGLMDKNGKRIFEGDIIRIPDDYDEFGRNAGEIYEIYFCCGGFRLKPKYSMARGYWLEDDETVEVIGNIHDNPELLKEEGRKHD
jgi:uncharacterized phage protein (TIGR01671 family)